MWVEINLMRIDNGDHDGDIDIHYIGSLSVKNRQSYPGGKT